jgi:hypothetical protein
MTDKPYIKIWKRDISIDFPEIRQGSIKREWMDKTYKRLAYFCPPITQANVHGWEFLLPHDVVVRWDGISEGFEGEDSSHVSIVSGGYLGDLKIATVEPAVGQITFLFNLTVQTDPNHYLIISGPPNYIFPDAEPLNAIWRSDFFKHHDLSFAWKMTTKDKDIVFPKGMPIAFMINYPKELLESTEISIHDLTQNKELEEDIDKYIKKRTKLSRKLGQYNWAQLYRNGIGPNDEKFLDKPFKPKLQNPKIQKETNEAEKGGCPYG